jgi:thiol-disulfide isomerase/thioredoxin
MIERIIALGIVFLLIGIFRKVIFHGTSKLSIQLPDKYSVKNSHPTILYFWTDQCVQCKTSQKPALVKLKNEYDKFNLIDVNALTEKELTSTCNIKTVPSTVVFSKEGKSRFINNGFRNKEELLKQLSAARN